MKKKTLNWQVARACGPAPSRCSSGPRVGHCRGSQSLVRSSASQMGRDIFGGTWWARSRLFSPSVPPGSQKPSRLTRPKAKWCHRLTSPLPPPRDDDGNPPPSPAPAPLHATMAEVRSRFLSAPFRSNPPDLVSPGPIRSKLRVPAVRSPPVGSRDPLGRMGSGDAWAGNRRIVRERW